MIKMHRKKKKTALHPIMSFLILILITIIVSGVLGLLNFSTNYSEINVVRGTVGNATAAVKSLLNLSGLKLIFSQTVSNFATFAPLVNLIIILIGIGIMDKSGFLQSFFTLVTKHTSKYAVTLFLSILAVVAGIAGDIMYIVLIPIYALLYKYSKRNPKAGIILGFAGLTCGSGINIFMNSVSSSLLSYTKLAASTVDLTYKIDSLSWLFVMIFMTIVMSIIISNIIERVIIPRLKKPETDDEEFYLDRKKQRGLLFSLTIGTIYLLIFIYNIIPGLPGSGNLLDYSQNYYIDKLFGYNSFFNQGFVFVITLFFFLLGLFYGLGAKTIKNNQDVCNYLGHSLDDVGKTLVLIFFASAFISIFKATNIGDTVVALVANLLSTTKATGVALIIIAFLLIALVSILAPSPINAWSILSGSMIPTFMNAGMSAEFAQLVFRAANSVTFGITPIMAYFVIYLAFLDKYSDDDNPTTLLDSIKQILPFSGVTALVWIIVLIVLYVTGLPMGIGAVATI